MFEADFDFDELDDLIKDLSPEQVEKVLNQSVNLLGKFALYRHRSTVRTWTNKPNFELVFEAQEGGAYFLITHDSQIYRYVDEGTGLYGPKHSKYPIRPKKPGGVLRFQAGYKAKTRVGKAWSYGGGGSFGPYVYAREVMHPGIEGRGFSELISSEIGDKTADVIFFFVERAWEDPESLDQKTVGLWEFPWNLGSNE